MTFLAWPFRWLDDARRDVRHAWRLLSHTPGVTLTAALSLAIGIGATTTAVAVADALLFQPPPGVAEPARLVDIGSTRGGSGFGPSSYRDYLDVTARASTLERVYAYSRFPIGISVRDGGQPESATATLVTASYFSALGAVPRIGRLFGPAESDEPGRSPVVVLGHGYWTRRFARDPAIVGRSLSLNGAPFTVIGVTAEGFCGTGVRTLDLFVPIGMAGAVGAAGERMLTDRSARGLLIGARVKPGVSEAQVAADVDLIGSTLDPEPPSAGPRLGLRATPASPIPGRHGPLVAVLTLLVALVGCVLLVACANVAGILLARGAARRREIAVRLAIGSGRLRLARQLLAEALLLFAIGGAAGVLVGAGLTAVLAAWLPAAFPVSLTLAIDARAIGITSAITLLAAVLAGLTPAVDAARADVLDGLRTPAPAARRLRLRQALVGAQVACSLVLVIGAGLFTRALVRAATVDPGFDPRGVELATLDLGQGGLTEQTGPAFARELRDRIRGLASVEAASMAITPPGGVEVRREALGVPASGRPDLASVDFNVVEPGYFATLRIRLVAGRDFTDADRAGTQLTVIVSESAARRFWPGRDPIGQYLSQPRTERGGTASPRMLLVVGVARDIQSSTLVDGLGHPGVYVPLQQQYVPSLTIVTRTRHGERVVDELRRLVASMDPSLPLTGGQILDDAITFGLTPQRVAAAVAGALGVVGLILTGIGIHGVIAYTVTRRTREIGVRIALGAQRSDVIAMVLRDGAWLAAIGSVAGAGLAMLASRVLAGFLFGVSPADPVTLAGTGLLFVMCALLACGAPVRRATRIQPAQALRDE